jgi:hypothetical protein
MIDQAFGNLSTRSKLADYDDTVARLLETYVSVNPDVTPAKVDEMFVMLRAGRIGWSRARTLQ